jgi:hypothetical protein
MTNADAALAMMAYREAAAKVQTGGFETLWWVIPETIPSPTTGNPMTNGAKEWTVKVGGEYADGENWFIHLRDFVDYLENRWPKRSLIIMPTEN